MCQIGPTREIICSRHWRDHPGPGEAGITADLQRIGESVADYAAPFWSTNLSDSSFKKIQTTQNAALGTATLKVKDHSDMLSAQYLVNCLEEDHVCHGITTQEP